MVPAPYKPEFSKLVCFGLSTVRAHPSSRTGATSLPLALSKLGHMLNAPRSSLWILLVLTLTPALAERVVVPLDGQWQIADSLAPDAIPTQFDRVVPVPGLANLAQPAFEDIDRFDSRELIWNLVRRGELPKDALTRAVGIPRQKRNYLWYRRTFTVPLRRERAILKIGKAQFGTAVWLNGRKIGEYLGCFTASYFDVTSAVDWESTNTLLVRVGAHPAALPPWAPAGTDFEKRKWTPGVYDRVELWLTDPPIIEWVQVAPRLNRSSVLVQVQLSNPGAARTATLTHRVLEWDSQQPVAQSPPLLLHLAADERRQVTVEIPIPRPRLWSPESPFLYVLETSTGGDTVRTRFGMREFRFDTTTRRAYLNGRVYFLRGSNITLHRFFEDPLCKNLPWRRDWVRKLLGDIPKQLHWNAFRFCIGPVPDFWLDIADEVGLLIQNEFFMWTGRNGFHEEWSTEELIQQYSDWVRDNWNHPSVVIWDASNETWAPVFNEHIIPRIRHLDLSNRPWENGYNLPHGLDDPVEDHPYLFSSWQSEREPRFHPVDLERSTGGKTTNAGHPTGHATIINEYGWLWLNRDGTPTVLTTEVYRRLVGERATPAQRFSTQAYYLAGLTEYWRAHRNAAGVLHFVYLTSSYPGAFTSDHFVNVESLELQPDFLDYVGQAFRPLGVYLNFWQPQVQPAAWRRFSVMMVNDLDERVEGSLVLELQTKSDGRVLARAQRPFQLAPLGQHTYELVLEIPTIEQETQCILAARALPHQPPHLGPTTSRRWVTITDTAR